MAASNRPKVLVVENPDAAPDVLTIGEVEVVETSSYPLSSYVSDDELAGMEPLHYATLAKQFPPDSEPYKLLLDFQQRFETHLAERGVTITPDEL